MSEPLALPLPKKLSPLLGLLPFLKPYWLRWIWTFMALIIAAGTTLTLPVVFRYLIDSGFSSGQSEHLNRYFILLFGLSIVLAVATALRFYFVSWLGERVTADIRSAIYSHILRMSPQFFEITKTGEVLSRLTTDTTFFHFNKVAFGIFYGFIVFFIKFNNDIWHW